MEMKDILKDEFGFLRGRVFEVDPKKEVGVAQQSRHQEHFNVLAV
jgi:hypothetical protein